MGLAPDDFWEYTSEEFEILRQHSEERELAWDLRFGVVASGYWNLKVKPEYQKQPGEFFGYLKQEEREMTIEETIAYAQSLSQAHNARLSKPS